MLYREIIAVCSQIHTKHINTLCGQNVELLNVKPGDTQSILGTIKEYGRRISVACCTTYCVSQDSAASVVGKFVLMNMERNWKEICWPDGII